MLPVIGVYGRRDDESTAERDATAFVTALQKGRVEAAIGRERAEVCDSLASFLASVGMGGSVRRDTAVIVTAIAFREIG